MPQGGTPPHLRQSQTASPPPMSFGTSHLPRAPTPPLRTEGPVINLPTRPQSPSLPGLKHDLMLSNTKPILQAGGEPKQPQTVSGIGPQTVGMTASQLLGTLAGSLLPTGLPNISSTPSNLLLSSVPSVVTSSIPKQKTMDAGLPDLVASGTSLVVTSSSGTGSLSRTARVPDVVMSVAKPANGDIRHSSCKSSYPAGNCDVIHKADPSALLKTSQSKSDPDAYARVANPKELSSVVKDGVVVNGTAKDSPLMNAKATVVNTLPTMRPAVNG